MYRAYGDDSAPDLLNLRKKEIRRKIMSHPEIAFYNMFHISDSILDAKREIAIYEKYIQ